VVHQIINLRNMKKLILYFFILILIPVANAQNIDDLLDDAIKNEISYTAATFKTGKIINGQSVEQTGKNHLDFRISHRFGSISSGIDNFFGIDQSTINLSFEYGLTDRLMLGFGRSSYMKTYNGVIKFKILRQSTGKRNMPISLSYFGSTELFSANFSDPQRNNKFTSRLTYINQILISRKFGERLSLQLTPTVIHKNIVPTVLEMNDIFSCGIGGRYKLTKRMAISAEYYYTYKIPRSGIVLNNPIGLGIDIETGGHVFQIMLTNTSIMQEGGFIYGVDNDNFFKGGIHLGFNISRTFTFN
jgi:hypothetical protein